MNKENSTNIYKKAELFEKDIIDLCKKYDMDIELFCALIILVKQSIDEQG